jgi:hypothetical protein
MGPVVGGVATGGKQVGVATADEEFGDDFG